MAPKLPDDLKSSIVVSLVALPLCLGIALASGAPLSSGILAGIIGGIITGLVSNSHISVSGPAAGLTVIVLAQIERFGLTQFYNIVLMAGLLQIFFSLIKGGRIGDLFPNAVIHGMLAAIGITLIIKQIPLALGSNLSEFSLSPQHLLISLITLVTIITWDKFNFRFNYLSFIPSALLAVGISIILNISFDLFAAKDLVSIPDQLLSTIHMNLPSSFSLELFMGAVTIAVVASLETLLCIDAADKIDHEKRVTNKNRELLAQGLGNTLCGIIGALPVTAVIVRTTTNIGAGAKTKWSAIFHGLWLLLFISLGSSLLNKVPLATLAVILLIVGYRLSRPALFKMMYKKGIDQFFIFCATIIAILMTDLLKGIIIGLVICLIMEAKFFKNKVTIKEVSKNKLISFNARTTYFTRLTIQQVFSKLREDEILEIQKSQEMNPDVQDLIDDLKKRYPEKIVIS